MTACRYETVIIGGGIAGLACARRLHDSRRPFLLITEDVGGRIRTSADGAVNVGAYYVRSDYSHVNRFVDRGRRIERRHLLRGFGCPLRRPPGVHAGSAASASDATNFNKLLLQ